MGLAAAKKAVYLFQKYLSLKPTVRFIVATGTSQFEFLNNLTESQGIDWKKTELFHLDEYVGISENHPASFRKYIFERIINKIHLGKFNLIKGDTQSPEIECKRMGLLISKAPIDIAFVGIGENGHLAFNDPPADFKTEEPYIIVKLDEQCRKQQVNEGWFKSIEDVPQMAISMSIQQIMKAENIICVCPDKRKAKAVRDCLSTDLPISPNYPASILKQHKSGFCFLDRDAASLLKQ
jgi:glucosamine-6-phosphate deaminase